MPWELKAQWIVGQSQGDLSEQIEGGVVCLQLRTPPSGSAAGGGLGHHAINVPESVAGTLNM